MLIFKLNTKIKMPIKYWFGNSVILWFLNCLLRCLIVYGIKDLLCFYCKNRFDLFLKSL